MNIKNVIFDIGGVLAYSKSGHWFITPKFWEIVDINLIDKKALNNSLSKFSYLRTQEPKTEKEEEEMFSNYYYHVLKEINYPNINREISNKIAYDCVHNDDKFIFYDDDKSVLDTLYKDYNLYIISDGWPSSLRVLKNKGFANYFKGILISSIYGTVKLDRLFDIFINEHKEVNPKESIYIDDRNDILEKAKQYNFNVLLMDRDNHCNKTKFDKINNMSDILKRLD